MELILLRHGIAEHAVDSRHDDDRPLSEAGRAHFRAALRTLDKAELLPDAIYTSPWVRAAQSAALLGDKVALEPRATLLLAAPPHVGLLALIADAQVERLALVGHQPWLGELLAWLVVGRQDTPLADNLRIKKAGFAWLRGDPTPGGMQLRALFPPRRRP